MLLNDAKGSYGMFSRPGIDSVGKYNILLRKDEILSGNVKKMNINKGMIQDLRKLDNDEDEEDLDIFFDKQTYGTLNKIQSNPNTKSIKEKKKKNTLSSHNLLLAPKKYENPSCTRYNPKFDYVWNRCLSGPDWNKSIHRTKSLKKAEKLENKSDFYISHQTVDVQGKNLVRFDKMSSRDNSLYGTIYTNSEEKKSKSNYLLSKFNTQSTFTKSTQSLEDQFMNTKTTKKKKVYVRCQAPDFKKSMSRDQLDRIIQSKKILIPFINPNLNPVIPRSVNFVHYDKMTERKEMLKSKTDFFDFEKYLKGRGENAKKKTRNQSESLGNTRNSEKSKKYVKFDAPNFRLSTSRPSQGKLPSYMQKVFFRQEENNKTENSLKANNFENSKFLSTSSSVWPKKTFNRIINLNIMNSTNFQELVAGNKEDDGEEKVDKFLKTSMKFYNKNFDEILDDALRLKFDGITFKTFKKKTKIGTAELEKYLIKNET